MSIEINSLSFYRWQVLPSLTVSVKKNDKGLEFCIENFEGIKTIVPRDKIFGWPSHKQDILDEQFIKNCLVSCRKTEEGYCVEFEPSSLDGKMLDNFYDLDLIVADQQLQEARKSSNADILVQALL